MKQDRIEFRISHQERQQIETAASFLGMNVSTYLRLIALERSVEILKNSETVVLSDRDRDLFLRALENPPKPNKNLKKAFASYRRKGGKFS
ncbi:MAG TPA: DUF1778 domain-containing protein [Chlamydiales bacterium]|nr:DUF1778 domain-containing protein [Chlamydiales bacterium]